MTVNFKCKFCEAPRVMEVEDNNATMFCIEKWLPILCCDRCGKYMERKRVVEDAFKRVCFALTTARFTLDGEKSQGIETKIKSKLEQLTKRYVEIVCKHWRVTNVWDMEFPNMLFDKPEKWFTIARVYADGIRKISLTDSRQPTL